MSKIQYDTWKPIYDFLSNKCEECKFNFKYGDQISWIKNKKVLYHTTCLENKIAEEEKVKPIDPRLLSCRNLPLYKERLIETKETENYEEDLVVYRHHPGDRGLIFRRHRRKKYLCFGGPNNGRKLTEQNAGNNYMTYNCSCQSWNKISTQNPPKSILLYVGV